MSPNHRLLQGWIALAALPTSLLGTVSVDVPSAFTALDPTMPASFEVGQEVGIAFNYNEASIGIPTGDTDFFFNAVTDFSFTVPEAGFSLSGGTGDIIRDAQGRLTLTMVPLLGFTPIFEGQEFELVEMVLLPGVISVASSGLPASLDGFRVESFQVQFINPAGVGTGRSLGELEAVAAPEPGTVAMLFGLTALGFGVVRGCGRRRLP
ncbi:MAG: hypothetical protein ACFB20_04860 [Opitutales bacterium]